MKKNQPPEGPPRKSGDVPLTPHLHLISIAPEINHGDAFYRCHLRNPSTTEDDLRKILKNTNPQTLPKIVIHSHYTLAKEFPIAGIHLTEQSRRDGKDYSEFTIVSAAIHALDDPFINDGTYEYLVLAPFFPSISKPNVVPHFRLEQVAELPLHLRQKLVALGGVSHRTLPALLPLSLFGAALLGALRDDPLTELARCNQVLAQ